MKEIAKQFKVDWEPDEQAVVDPLAPIPAPTGVSVSSAGASGPDYVALYAAVRLFKSVLAAHGHFALAHTGSPRACVHCDRALQLVASRPRCRARQSRSQWTRARSESLRHRRRRDYLRRHHQQQPLLRTASTSTHLRRSTSRLRLQISSSISTRITRNSSQLRATRMLHRMLQRMREPSHHSSHHTLQHQRRRQRLQALRTTVASQTLTSSLRALSGYASARTRTARRSRSSPRC